MVGLHSLQITTMASFTTPAVSQNSKGWGPTDLPKQFLNIPYAPFGKLDKLGKAADFTAQYQSANPNRPARYQRTNDPSGVNAEFQYKHDTIEDQSFQLVDTAKATRNNTRLRPTWGQQRFAANRLNNRNGKTPGQGPPVLESQSQMMKKGQQKQNKRWDRLSNARRMFSTKRRDGETKERMASVQVSTEWKLVQQFELMQLMKLQANIPPSEDLKTLGTLHKYDDNFDRISARTAKPLARFEVKENVAVTTTEDPVIESLATEGAGTVFATDAILAHLMSCPRSVYPWDIVVQRVNNLLFFDKRDISSGVDLLSVNETALEPPNPDEPDSVNHPDRLAVEATDINTFFAHQVLRPAAEFSKAYGPNPFPDNTAPVAYKYRRWALNESVNLVARCEVNALSLKGDVEQTVKTFALNEWDPKLSGSIDWRKKIDSQRGALLANELKNNAPKIAQWTHSALLANAGLMKLGYVTRHNTKDSQSHVILATQSYNPVDFAQQTSLNLTNAWGIIKMLVELFMEQPEGKYVMMKDPNKPVVRIYSVPLDTFEDENGGDDDDEDDEEDDDNLDDDDEIDE
ncbi:hypothetical protein H257_01301 [Aphanomyces astaci]|uniref:EIF3d n=2 Tax=Aphanomyces astaci TaxID=112090 RepID=W4H764_APHAT|nr:hypothetical protein H257_01301 [Aphanomyces astaci]ETV87880.1 hypothetical protein H257_01301 [Aphanomyces astaci]RHY05829.1 hypothetical protein DYB25_002396 [Aphanomyces astaci]RQM20454.1 hypothetical protein B5M09_001681 [Aphanomyces astaci]|eukprot:XP_009822743.1 hypothetical protein H257_01301 [Aphanomyces astaci]